MKTYKIYKLTNTADGNKSYIGQSTNPEWRCRPSLYNGRYIKAAIKEFGWENFKLTILEEVTTISEANALERRFIAKYDTVFPNGYNFQYGGSYSRRFVHRSDETSDRQSKTMSRKRWYFNPETDETIRLLPEEEIPSGFVPGRGSFRPTNPFGNGVKKNSKR